MFFSNSLIIGLEPPCLELIKGCCQPVEVETAILVFFSADGGGWGAKGGQRERESTVALVVLRVGGGGDGSTYDKNVS